MDWDRASKLLSQDLDTKVVKTRSGGGGKQLSYIDHFEAIDAANRIFGHGGWSRHTVLMRQISDKPIAYMAKVRITIGFGGPGEVSRDGYGYGADPTGRGDHEKALKEAETDATKRALMTFGYPLGLALYQKEGEREHVSDGNGAEQPDLGSIKGEGPSRHASNTPYLHLRNEMLRNDNPPDLNLWWVKSKVERERTLNSEHRIFLFKEMIQHGLDTAADFEEQKGFWTVHKHGLEELKQRNASEYSGLEMYKEKVKKK